MQPLNEADKIVRSYLPLMLEAAGRPQCANELRYASPIEDLQSVLKATKQLQQLSNMTEQDTPWTSIIEDALFWCEAATWAAIRDDLHEFADHVNRAEKLMQSGMKLLTSH